MMYYLLKDRQPVLCSDPITWARELDSKTRTVAQSTVGDVRVSTIFTGMDYTVEGQRPLVFETMVFYPDNTSDRERYTSWEAAEEGHRRIVEAVRKRQQ
jgi:hypothetical protein